jgi:uncharacterized protein Yka (UPF0111/DUF47 family)
LKPDKRTAKVIEALNLMEERCDPTQHQALIDLIHDYKGQLSTNDNITPILNHLMKDLSTCILDNHLKAPKEITELIQTLHKLARKDTSIQLTNWLL